MALNMARLLFYVALGLCLNFGVAMAADEEMSDSLTEYVQESTNKDNVAKVAPKPGMYKSDADEEAVQEEKSWINNLVTTVAEKSASADDEVQISVHRSNASVFDISGVMLRMNREQAAQAMQKRGYRKMSEKLEIPNFIRWRYEEICRNQGVIGFERIGSCVVQMAKKNNYQYVEHEKYNNFQTKEEVEIYYTSNFTGNKVYRVMYRTEAANVFGSGAKATYLRNLKIFDFWKKINQKYGVPDNKEQIIWGLGENKPSLQAATGRLILNDPMLLELDYTRMSREDQKFMNTAIYTF
jgi:hypothetical protein